jgi:arylsulfatase A-like enzyme
VQAASDEASAVRSAPDRGAVGRCVALALALGGALLLNELAANLFSMWHLLGGPAARGALTSQAVAPAVRDLLGRALGMLALAGVLTLAAGAFWAGVLLTARRALHEQLAGSRARRWLFWFAGTFCWLNVHYTLHQTVLPGSRLGGSLLASLVGAGPAMEWPVGALLLVTLPVTSALVLLALSRSRSLRRLTACAVLLLGGTLLIHERATAPDASRPFTADGHVVLIGLDSFQLNRLAAGGGEPGLAPHVDAFLEQSFRFDNAWTPFARTYPSWMSLLTGRPPPQHGVRFNLTPDEALDEGNRYLPAVLAEQGYTTAHATDETRFSVLRPRFGYQHMLHPEMGLVDFVLGSYFDFSTANLVRQTTLGHDLFPAVANNRASAAYRPELFVRNVLALIDELPRDRPAFINVHLCGNHWPFSAPAPWAWRGRDEVESCVAMVDDQLGRLLEHLRRTGLLARSTTILLSDHGDGWSGDPEDTTNTHGDGFAAIESNHILLALQGPGIRPGVSHALVRIQDLYPTVLERVGVDWDEGGIDGRSLWPLVEGRSAEPRVLHAESGLDQSHYGVKRLVEEHVGLYRVDPRTGLVFLRDENLTRLAEDKSYLLMEGDRRLEVTPSLGRFELVRIDPETGRDVGAATDLDEEVRRELLQRLVAHHRLDAEEVFGAAGRTGFLREPRKRSPASAGAPRTSSYVPGR